MPKVIRSSLLLAPAALALASGCQPVEAPAGAPDDSVTFACADGTTLITRLEADRNALSVIIPGRAQLRLPQVASASGARYSNGNITFWNKGSEGQWIVGERPPVTCQSAT